MNLLATPRQVFRSRNFGGRNLPRPEAFPIWKTLLPTSAKDTDSSFIVGAGRTEDVVVEFQPDSFVRMLWPRFSICEQVGGRWWDSLSRDNLDDVEDIREGCDFGRWVDLQIVVNSANGLEMIPFTPVSNIHGANEFGRVRLPYLLGKEAMVTYSVRNRYSAPLLVAAFVHGWRIML